MLVMFIDKKRAIKKKTRVPEAVLFMLGNLLGGAGLIIGMFLFRHKIRKWYFIVGLPIIAVQNIILSIVFLRLI